MSDALMGGPNPGAMPRQAGSAPFRHRFRDIVAALRLGLSAPGGPARFLVAGGLASAVNWLVRFPLSGAMPFEPAVALAYALGMVVGFVLYRSWVFPGSTLPFGQQISRFVLVNAAGLAVVIVGAKIFVAAIALTGAVPSVAAEAIAHALAIVLGALVNFAGHRAVTFARVAVRTPPRR